MSNGMGVFVGLLATLVGGAVLTGIGILIMLPGGQPYENLGAYFMMAAGLIQLAYVVPMYKSATRSRNEGLKIGLVIGAGIVFLFNAACGALIQSFSSGSFR